MLSSLRKKTFGIYCGIHMRSIRSYHEIPFLSLYREVTGDNISNQALLQLQKKHPSLVNLSKESLQCTLQVLNKFGITADEACKNVHLFCMNQITMDNYGEVLKECRFTNILPQYIIRYHTIVKSWTIFQLKKKDILESDLNLEEVLFQCLDDLPKSLVLLHKFHETKTNIVTVRTSVLEKYLQWRLGVSSDEFRRYCKTYLPMRHRPMCDIQKSIKIAENEFKFHTDLIRRNGFIIMADPINTKLILEKVDSLGGLEIRDAIKLEPAILKNNFQSLLEIKDILQAYNINNDMQKRCLRVFCMKPATVRDRLEHITNLKEYPVLSTNPRMLLMVVHEKKMMNRLKKMDAVNKRCYSFNHLVSASGVFNTYINSFGEKVCGKDVSSLIEASLIGEGITTATVLTKLKRHKYYLHSALLNIKDNIQMLKGHFTDDVIFDNCQILLYPMSEIKQYVNYLLQLRKGESMRDALITEVSFNNINTTILTDNHLLSLVMYDIEKRYHFSGDGIWHKLEGGKIERTEENVENR